MSKLSAVESRHSKVNEKKKSESDKITKLSDTKSRLETKEFKEDDKTKVKIERIATSMKDAQREQKPAKKPKEDDKVHKKITRIMDSYKKGTLQGEDSNVSEFDDAMDIARSKAFRLKKEESSGK